jgi:phosphatidylserine decarboxylase
MKDALIVTLLSLTPRKRGARSLGWFARTRMSKLMVRLFVRVYGIQLDEAEGGIKDYPTLEALFVRPLKPGARPICANPGAIVSPVDGVVAAVGRTTDGRVEIAPERYLVLSDLLRKKVEGERDVVVLYLSPQNYHRVHVPRESKVVGWQYLPGTLWPVFPAAVRRVRALFSRNERVSLSMETDFGPLDLVMVGAFGVGRITLTICDVITNSGGRACTRELARPIPLQRGDELGTFHLGSTVVLSTPPGSWQWTVAVGETVRMGQAIGKSAPVLTDDLSLDFKNL